MNLLLTAHTNWFAGVNTKVGAIVLQYLLQKQQKTLNLSLSPQL